MKIRFANLNDMEGIISLLKKNHADYIEDKSEGFVTTNITDEQLKRLIEVENGVVIAENDGKIIAFAFAAPWKYWSEWPFFSYMIEILPEFSFDGKVLSSETSYQYGPVCIDKDYRGEGIFEKVFEKSLSSMNRFPVMVTFINKINPRSYAAHTKKVNMEEVGDFTYNGNNYYIMAIKTK